ncbi:class II aldolase/adducin family protein [Propionispira raffinosivorans]|uniref:class II aldolase/adducin family protein n=1 Tax=Propionispira raffinosivorans TaxID=86959 RepID=UPI00037F1848|nr:class II aldolase/adducin family protein [Propionispira raffinosivorans]
MDHNLKKEIIQYAKLLEAQGLVNSLEGNISILDRTAGELYITPSGTRKTFLTEDMIAVMKGDQQIGGTLKRSSEYLLHEAALRVRPDCNAVVHAHAPYLTAYAYCNKSINIRCSTTFGLFFGDIPCLPYGEPGTVHIADGIEEAMKEHELILLANHGCVCIGKTMENAVSILEAAEAVMKIYQMAKTVGEISDLSPEQWEQLGNNHPGRKSTVLHR